ncbi:potassium transporter 5-like isoform X2 [Hevea brasiliensis]|uniref:potassium transporter 5-like isoform X2 n=1 Tax=Hevea brasiliensis TaxID=3981 RepID=UPI000B780FB9|nr:potassium transporter 5-like isoform X2 [Hevea brasiliensis]
MAELEEERSSLEEQQQVQEQYGHKTSLAKQRSFDLEADGGSTYTDRQKADRGTILKLAFQCIGVAYGDLGTSPLYVLPGIFPDGIKNEEDIFGVLSLIIYSIIIIAFIKYVFIALAANDNGDGGTFALYSLICRHAKVNLIPNQQAEDREVSKYKLDLPKHSTKLASALKYSLESSLIIKYSLFFTTLIGVSMVLGDGILTPCISVLSAVGGIREAAPSLSQDAIMWISVVILILLFQVQRFGTDKVGYTFAPILVLWFAFIAFIGLFNFIKYDPGVIKAVNPWYIVKYFQRNKKKAWISIGGVILCLTGSEALFADLGHFNIRSIQLSSCAVLFPSVLLAYIGQCSYLRKNTEDVTDAFYKSIPKPMYWPQFVVAVLAAIIASQSLISASFSIVQQSVALGCFPRIKVVHTSAEHEGQVYVPEINTLLMLACVGVTLGFKNTLTIGNAYGIAVTFVFVITSSFLVLVMVMIWKTNIILIIIYVLTIGLIEVLFLSSTLYKFTDGGYLPLLFALIVVSIMFIWNYGYRKKYMYELENKIAMETLTDIVSDERIHRAEGLGLFYTHLVHGISPIFTHYVSHVQALHKVLVFVSIKSLPISRVPAEERFLFQRVKPGELVFQCIVRYGYKDSRKDQKTFEELLANQLKEFIEEDGRGEDRQRELALVDTALRDGFVYLMGECEVMAANGSTWVKKLTVDYLYNWLSRCVRQPDEVFLIPRKQLLKVGMTYDV